jgi:hypothetical protein
LLGIEQAIDENQTGLRQVVLLREQLRERPQIQNITQEDAEQLAVPINPDLIQIRARRA